MEEAQASLLRELADSTKQFVLEHGVSWTIRAWEEAAQLKLSWEDREKYLHFLLSATAVVVQTIPHFSGASIKAHAGIDPQTNIPFILASSEEYDHCAKWFARPINHQGNVVTEITSGWYEDGRDALC